MENTEKDKLHGSPEVRMNESWEIDYWCEKFQCSEGELKRAIRLAGTSPKAIEQYFESKNNRAR